MARRPNWQRFLPKGSKIILLGSAPSLGVVLGHNPRGKLMKVRDARAGARDRGRRWAPVWLRMEGVWWARYSGEDLQALRAEYALLR